MSDPASRGMLAVAFDPSTMAEAGLMTRVLALCEEVSIDSTVQLDPRSVTRPGEHRSEILHSAG